MKITVEMTEEELKEYLRIRRCIRGKRESKEILDLAERLERLAEATYNALHKDEESAYVEIINDGYARAALALAARELF